MILGNLSRGMDWRGKAQETIPQRSILAPVTGLQVNLRIVSCGSSPRSWRKSTITFKRQIEHFEQHTLKQRRAEDQMHLLKTTKLEQDLANSQARVMDLSMELAKALKLERKV